MHGMTKYPPGNGLANGMSGRQQAQPGLPADSISPVQLAGEVGLRNQMTRLVPSLQTEALPPYLNNRSPTSDDAHVGSRIKQLRRASGRTQKQIAKIVGVTGAQFHRYETGSTRVAASRLIAIAAALHVRPEILMGNTTTLAEAEAPIRSHSIAESDDLVELVEVYETIIDPRRRHALIAFARAVARGQHSQIAEE